MTAEGEELFQRLRTAVTAYQAALCEHATIVAAARGATTQSLKEAEAWAADERAQTRSTAAYLDELVNLATAALTPVKLADLVEVAEPGKADRIASAASLGAAVDRAKIARLAVEELAAVLQAKRAGMRFRNRLMAGVAAIAVILGIIRATTVPIGPFGDVAGQWGLIGSDGDGRLLTLAPDGHGTLSTGGLITQTLTASRKGRVVLLAVTSQKLNCTGQEASSWTPEGLGDRYEIDAPSLVIWPAGDLTFRWEAKSKAGQYVLSRIKQTTPNYTGDWYGAITTPQGSSTLHWHLDGTEMYNGRLVGFNGCSEEGEGATKRLARLRGAIQSDPAAFNTYKQYLSESGLLTIWGEVDIAGKLTGRSEDQRVTVTLQRR